MEKLRYESKAKAMGFKNPHIVAASLQANQIFESKTTTNKGDYYIKYTIVSYDASRKTLAIGIDGKLPNGTTLKGNLNIITNVSVGSIQDISSGFSSVGMPRIFLQILDLPTPNSAIFAIGEKPNSSDKAS